MVFHEITREAIGRALEDTRVIDQRLVDAQETRRILDRLYGYEVSPVLWKKVTRGLSAGRVQSVATRLVVQRERERIAFVSAELLGPRRDLRSRLVRRAPRCRSTGGASRRAATSRPTGRSARRSSSGSTRTARAGSPSGSRARRSRVRTSDEKPYRRRPAAPFRTATLQQEASRKLRFSAQTTMRVAQRLYESGYITYMRTDSTTLSESALAAARAQVRELFGDDYVPEKPRAYGRAVANAQEAHEAIRPAGDTFRTPDELKRELSRDEHALYDLIWKRTLASQMEDARGQTVSLRIGATSSHGRGRRVRRLRHRDHVPRLSRRVRAGPRRALRRRRGAPPSAARESGRRSRSLTLEPEGHSTSPPPRYTEPTLVKALEDRGIGRPSTYAAILSTILDRGYVFKKGTALVPTFLAFAVVNLLERHFEQLVDFDFTARMEDDLDRIAAGDEERVAWLARFYFGDGDGPGLHHLVTEHLDEIDARAVNSIAIPGSEAVVRVGRYGPYLERGEARASLPADLAPDELTAEKADGAARAARQPPARPRPGDRPRDRRALRPLRPVRDRGPARGRRGEAANRLAASPRCRRRPSRSTTRCACSRLPRVVGELDGEDVTAQNGRYGPYVKNGSESRSLETEEQLFTVTLDEAKALFAQPPRRRGRGAARGPLRELGDDPGTGKKIVVKDGRFGPYVTDGETNASLREGTRSRASTHRARVELSRKDALRARKDVLRGGLHRPSRRS